MGRRLPQRRPDPMNEIPRSEPPALSPELCDRLLYYAWRAPSPHNAQGWRIEVDGPVFRVSRDLARQVLREFDPEGRETDLACGAVVTNLCVGRAGVRLAGRGPLAPGRQDGSRGDAMARPGGTGPDGSSPAAGAAPPRDEPLAVPPRSCPRPRRRRPPGHPKRLGFTLSVLTDRAGIDRMAAIAGRAGVMKLTHAPTQAELRPRRCAWPR